MSPPLSPSHDQNFKNLILDYPRQALQFFAPEAAKDVDERTIITPIRQEQLKNRLGDRFHELDVPLKVEWPDGRRAALLFLLEEESDPARFSIHRLGRYCLDLSELTETTRVVPVVIFLRSSPNIPKELHLGGDGLPFLSLRYIACVLPDIPAEAHKDSSNIVWPASPCPPCAMRAHKWLMWRNGHYAGCARWNPMAKNTSSTSILCKLTVSSPKLNSNNLPNVIRRRKKS